MTYIDTEITPSMTESAPTDQPQPEVDNQTASVQASEEQTTTAGNKEEGFFDPNSLPEELVPVYKQMQAAYTKKTQEIAQQRKEAETWKQKADEYSQYDQYIPIVREMLSNQSRAQESPEMVALVEQLKSKGYGDDAIELMKMGAQFTLNQFNQQRQQERQAQIQEKLSNQITEASKIDPRLSDESMVYQTEDGDQIPFYKIVENLVAADPNWTKDPIAATRRAIKQVDALIGQAKTEGKKELSASATNKAAKFSPTESSPQGAIDNEQPLSVKDAWKLAEKQLGKS